MSTKIPQEIQQGMARILKHMEETSELTRCVVVTRTGIKVAPDMDADTYSASSAALIDLGERVVTSLNHGTLQELVINALGGYVILVAVGNEYMLLGATSAALKMGYYLPYIRKKAWELEALVYGKTLTDFVLEEEEKAKAEEKASMEGLQVSMDEIQAADLAAMDEVLAAFDEFGIDDEFSANLTSSGESVPAVGISEEEMAKITRELQAQEEAEMDLTTTTQASPLGGLAPGPNVPEAAAPEDSSAAAGAFECPIPLEPGEVPPFPLEPHELDPLGLGIEPTPEETPAQAPVATPEAAPSPTPTPAPAPAPTPTPAPVAAQPAGPVAAPGPATEQPDMPQPSSSETEEPAPAPFQQEPEGLSFPDIPFDEASEYNFDFDLDPDAGKDIEIPDQDPMRDALKALGWEEEDN